MSEEKQYTEAKPIKKYGILSNDIFGFILRAAQFIVTILVLALSGNSLNTFATSGSMGFTIFTSIVSLLYLIIFVVFTFISPAFMILGAILILEFFITLCYFISFIAIAAVYGPLTCSGSYRYSWYFYSYDSSGCKASKAAIAFAAINFLLFLISLVSLSLSSFKTIPSADFWKTTTISGLILNKPFVSIEERSTSTHLANDDLETNGVGVVDAQTESNAEPKPNETIVDDVASASPPTTTTNTNTNTN